MGNDPSRFRQIRVVISPGRRTSAVAVVAVVVENGRRRENLIWRGVSDENPGVSTVREMLALAAVALQQAADRL